MKFCSNCIIDVIIRGGLVVTCENCRAYGEDYSDNHTDVTLFFHESYLPKLIQKDAVTVSNVRNADSDPHFLFAEITWQME